MDETKTVDIEIRKFGRDYLAVLPNVTIPFWISGGRVCIRSDEPGMQPDLRALVLAKVMAGEVSK